MVKRLIQSYLWQMRLYNRGHVVHNQIENNNDLNCKESFHVVYIMLWRLGFNPELLPVTICAAFHIFSVGPSGFPLGSLVSFHFPKTCWLENQPGCIPALCAVFLQQDKQINVSSFPLYCIPGIQSLYHTPYGNEGAFLFASKSHAVGLNCIDIPSSKHYAYGYGTSYIYHTE